MLSRARSDKLRLRYYIRRPLFSQIARLLDSRSVGYARQFSLKTIFGLNCHVLARLDFRRSLESGLRSSPGDERGLIFPNSGW